METPILGRMSAPGTTESAVNTCAEDLVLHHCTLAQGFGLVSDTIGGFNGAHGLGPGEPLNMQLAIKLIF